MVKSAQTGFEVTLPAKPVASLQVTSLFGESETNEGATCQVTAGKVDKRSLQHLFVTEAAK